MLGAYATFQGMVFMSDLYCHKKKETYFFREPNIEDGKDIYDLIERSKPLDLNSSYCYLLLAGHFCKTCVVAECDERLVGFISAYLHPSKRDTLFVWQVAVDGQFRNRGIAGSMLENLLHRPNLRSVSFLETTITPSNRESRLLFESFAVKLQAPCIKSILFSETLFGSKNHEEEVLFRIGPFGTL